MRKTLGLVALLWSMAALGQTGLQGFDRNYPDTPAGDNPRGFTPQISPVQKPPSPLPAPGTAAEAPAPSDPFTAPDPMIDDDAGTQDQPSSPMTDPASE